MISRGIQVVGLGVALVAFILTYLLRRKDRLTSRAFLFWVGFWLTFVIVDVFPSLVSYVTPYFDLGTNMFTLFAFSIMGLFMMVFNIYSYLSDLNYKVNRLVRRQALLDWKTNSLVTSLERVETDG